MERRIQKNRSPNATLEILEHLYQAEKSVAKLLTNDRTLIRSEIGKLRDLIMKSTKGLERRKADRRND